MIVKLKESMGTYWICDSDSGERLYLGFDGLDERALKPGTHIFISGVVPFIGIGNDPVILHT